MLNGLYAALAGMEAQKTPPTRSRTTSPTSTLPATKPDKSTSTICCYSSDGEGAGAAASASPSFAQGTLYEPARPLDVGIDDPWFVGDFAGAPVAARRRSDLVSRGDPRTTLGIRDPGLLDVVDIYARELGRKVAEPFGTPLIHCVGGSGYVLNATR